MTIQTTTRRAQTRVRTRRSLLLGLGLGVALAGAVALGGTAHKAEAAFTEKIVFSSDRTAGADNPTGDYEVFKMNPDGTGVRQLTFNEADDWDPTLSPDGRRISYETNTTSSNPEGDWEVYTMSALDGGDKRNLTNNDAVVDDYNPVFSPGGKRIAYVTEGIQQTNPEGDPEIYVLNASNGTDNKNLTNNGLDLDGVYLIEDYNPTFSPDGTKIAYTSLGKQPSNPEGDDEVYRLRALDGTGKKNLTNNGTEVDDYLPRFSPDSKRIAYESDGVQNSNPQGEEEVYTMNALDGKGKRNLSNNGSGVDDEYPRFSPGGKRIAYESNGIQSSNPQGDDEIYVMDALDGKGKRNLTNNGADVFDYDPDFSPDGRRISFTSDGVQRSNPEGDDEIYAMSSLDGASKRNLTNNGVDAYDSVSEWGVQAR